MNQTGERSSTHTKERDRFSIQQQQVRQSCAHEIHEVAARSNGVVLQVQAPQLGELASASKHTYNK